MQTQNFNMISLGLETAVDHCSRNELRQGSILAALRARLLWWCQYRGLLPVLLEIRSCYRRIQLGKKMRWGTSGLVLEQILASVPQVIFPRNCSETQSYSLSIQALEKERPYLTPADYELFAQAWFQAMKWIAHKSDRGCGKRGSSPFVTSRNTGMLDRTEKFSNAPNVVA